jgi:hypothetical protein
MQQWRNRQPFNTWHFLTIMGANLPREVGVRYDASTQHDVVATRFFSAGKRIGDTLNFAVGNNRYFYCGANIGDSAFALLYNKYIFVV